METTILVNGIAATLGWIVGRLLGLGLWLAAILWVIDILVRKIFEVEARITQWAFAECKELIEGLVGWAVDQFGVLPLVVFTAVLSIRVVWNILNLFRQRGFVMFPKDRR